MTTAELTKKDLFTDTLSTLDFSHEGQHYLSLRKTAREAIKNLEFPTSKTEYWKYTRVGKIINKKYTVLKTATIDITPFLIPDLKANIIVLINGYVIPSLSKVKENDNIKVLSLVKAKEKGIVIKDHFNKYTSGKNEIFIELNNAYHTDGVCIHTNKNAIIESPYHIINITTGNNTISQSRNLFIAEPGSSVKIIESFVNVDGSENFINNISEICVGENAQLYYNKIQDKKDENYSISTEQVYQSANSQFYINTATFNGALVRNNLNIEVDASNCETNLSGLYLGKNNDHIDNHTVVDHKKPHCNSNEIYKGVLDDESTGVFNGKVFVRPDAQITNAFQQNNNILLSDNATADSKPELEIYADDVKCSHGSTTGQIDDEAIFYLQSRGISKKGALNLMINAFAKDALENITIEALKNYIDKKIEERFA